MTSAQIIAADVALRYGVAVCPSVVQVCTPMTCAAVMPAILGRRETVLRLHAEGLHNA